MLSDAGPRSGEFLVRPPTLEGRLHGLSRIAAIFVMWLLYFIANCDKMAVMHVISKHALAAFWLKHDAARIPLEAWYRVVKTSTFSGFNDVKRTFACADYVPPFVVFDVGGNNFRVIGALHYDRHKVYIREVFTHAEYDRWSKNYRSKKS